MKLKTKHQLAILAATISAVFAGSTWANPVFTLTPSDASPTLTTNPGTITADTLTGTDNAQITFSFNGTSYFATETGAIFFNAASLGGVGLLGTQLAGLNSGGADTWGLYATFTATSAPAATFLQVNTPISLTFSLYGDPGNTTTFNSIGGITGGSLNDVLLASGTIGGTATLGGPPLNPSLSVAGPFNIAAGQGPGAGTFFTAPSPFYVNIGASATSQALGNISTNCPNTGPTVGNPCTLNIQTGAVTGGFNNVPEPATLALLGLGLLGIGISRRKQI